MVGHLGSFGILLLQTILLQQSFNEQLLWTSHCPRLLGEIVKSKVYFVPWKCLEPTEGSFQKWAGKGSGPGLSSLI